MYVIGSVDLCGPVDLWVVDRISISCMQLEVWISVDLWTCRPVGLWTCKPVDLWTCGPVDLWVVDRISISCM